ncbi:MAG TPA: glycoside hydrolase family 16 protein [Flavisolibacter sp.]|jgi:beta-glucanase (GH16 family)|nr:glycoside hydrolase family 16 protein [Flavisolibacter sp.]
MHFFSGRTKTAFAFLTVITCFACQKPVQTRETALAPASNAAARTEAAATTVTANAICDYVFNEQELTSAGWIKTFEDDFTTDLSKWNIWYGGAFNNELQLYRESNLQIMDGCLVITAQKEPGGVKGPTSPFTTRQKTFQYTSGRIECKTNVSANTQTPKVRMVARIKLAPGYGMWGAYWSYGDPWPTQGEIDMVEARGQEPDRYQTNYFYGRTRNRNLVTNGEGFIRTNGNLTTCYHVYEMIWEQNTLTSYLDGVQVEQKSGGYIPNLFGKTERITLNLAVGGDFFPNLDPSKIVAEGKMYVDYVKVFTSK